MLCPGHFWFRGCVPSFGTARQDSVSVGYHPIVSLPELMPPSGSRRLVSSAFKLTFPCQEQLRLSCLMATMGLSQVKTGPTRCVGHTVDMVFRKRQEEVIWKQRNWFPVYLWWTGKYLLQFRPVGILTFCRSERFIKMICLWSLMVFWWLLVDFPVDMVSASVNALVYLWNEKIKSFLPPLYLHSIGQHSCSMWSEAYWDLVYRRMDCFMAYRELFWSTFCIQKSLPWTLY